MRISRIRTKDQSSYVIHALERSNETKEIFVVYLDMDAREIFVGAAKLIVFLLTLALFSSHLGVPKQCLRRFHFWNHSGRGVHFKRKRVGK